MQQINTTINLVHRVDWPVPYADLIPQRGDIPANQVRLAQRVIELMKRSAPDDLSNLVDWEQRPHQLFVTRVDPYAATDQRQMEREKTGIHVDLDEGSEVIRPGGSAACPYSSTSTEVGCSRFQP